MRSLLLLGSWQGPTLYRRGSFRPLVPTSNCVALCMMCVGLSVSDAPWAQRSKRRRTFHAGVGGIAVDLLGVGVARDHGRLHCSAGLGPVLLQVGRSRATTRRPSPCAASTNPMNVRARGNTLCRARMHRLPADSHEGQCARPLRTRRIRRFLGRNPTLPRPSRGPSPLLSRWPHGGFLPAAVTTSTIILPALTSIGRKSTSRRR